MKKLPLYLILLLASCTSRAKFPPGGYDYPKHVADKDTNLYYYPTKNIQSRRDSFYDAYMYMFYKAMDEPNLSLKPLPAPVFRFLYEGYINPNHYIFTLTQNEITVKKLYNYDSSRISSFPDTNRLTPLERLHIKILDRDFPIDKKSPHRSPRRQAWLDSMGRVYPQLCDPAYYASLGEKEGMFVYHHYNYTVKTVKITPETFHRLVEQINASGYWQFPPKTPPDDEKFDVFDAAGYILEANTPQKYNMVEGCLCGGDSIRRIESILDELAKAAKMDKEIIGDTTRSDTIRRTLIVDDVQLEDVKEPKKPKHRHPVKTPHPN